VNVSATGTTFAPASASLIAVYDGAYEGTGARIFELLPTPSVNDLTGVEDIAIKLDPPGLSLAAGEVPVTSVTVYTCTNAACSTFTEDYSSSQVTGTVTALAPVPVPAVGWLFGSALGLLGWVRRKAAG